MRSIEMQSHGDFLKANPDITPAPCGAFDHAQGLGFRSFQANLLPSNNPYEHGTEAWWFWNCGWDSGERLEQAGILLTGERLRAARAGA